MLRSALLFLAAVVDTAILTSIVSTQLVLADVTSFGLSVPASDRLSATLHDLLGLALPLLLLIGLSFLVAFGVARFAVRFAGGSRTAWFMAAGFLSLPCAIFGIRLFMGGTLLASARTPLGMSLIACCGLLGGWFYAFLSSRFGSAGETGA